MIDTIIFDLGGVLVSDAPLYYENKLCDFSEALKFAGITKEMVEEIWKKHWSDMKIGKKDIQDIWEDLEPIINDAEKMEKFKIMYEEKIIIDEEVLKFIKSLKGKYKLISLANESKFGIDLKIKKFNLNALFEKNYCSAYIGVAKPNKKIFDYVIKDSKIDLQKTIFIDNQQNNIDGAKSVGINAILFTSLEQLKKDFDRLKIPIS